MESLTSKIEEQMKGQGDTEFSLPEGSSVIPDGSSITPFMPDRLTNKEAAANDLAVEQQEEALAAQPSKHSLWDSFDQSTAQNQALPLLFEIAGRPTLADDPEYVWNKATFEEHVANEFPETYWDEFGPDTIKSAGQLEQMKETIRTDMQRDAIIDSHGPGLGTAMRVFTAIADPGAILAGVATEGVLAPLIFTSKATRLTRAVRSGALAMAGTAPVEGFLAYASPTYDATDALLSTVTAGLFVGGLASRATPEEKALLSMKRSLEAHEAQTMGLKAGERSRADYESDGLLNTDGSFKDTVSANKEFFARNERAGTYGASVRMDMGADNFSSPSGKVRGLSGALFDDVAAAKGFLQGESAHLWKTRESGRVLRSYMKSGKTNFDAYREEVGVGWVRTHAARLEFNALVTRAARGGEVTSEAVKKHAMEVRRMYDEIGKMANNPGGKEGAGIAVRVKGAENMVLPNYVNRRWSTSAMNTALAKAGGDPAILKARIAKAIIGRTPEDAEAIAGHLVSVVTKSRQGGLDIDGLAMHGDSLELFLAREHGLDSSTASAIGDSLRRLVGGNDAGKHANLKSRIELDELQLEDLFENDIDTLFLGYSNSMMGQIAAARQGIGSEADFRRLYKEAREELEATPAKDRKERNKRARELRNLEASYDQLVGRAIGVQGSEGTEENLRLLRKFNYSRLMNMVGLAQIAEIGNAMGHLGIKAFIKNVPELAKLRRRMLNGDFKDDMLEELSDLTGGLGEYRLLRQSHQRIDDLTQAGITGGESTFNKVERGMDNLNAVTSEISLFNGVNEALHALSMKGMAQTFMDAARTGKHTLSTDRLRELGLDDAAMKSIKGELMKASRDAKGKVRKLNLDQWDEGTRNKFGNALRRWNDTIIQENGFGALPFTAHTTTGKVLLQFKSFMLAAWGKQMVNNVKHKDATAFMASVGSLMFGTLSYLAYVGASGAGRPDSDQYYKKMLTTEAISLGAIQKTGWSSILPGIVDLPASFGVYDPLFNVRNSGLDSNFLTGSATYDLLVNGVGKAGSEIVEAVRDQEFTQNTARALTDITPFKNALGLRNLYSFAFGHLRQDSNFD
jgi:hypothetical protein